MKKAGTPPKKRPDRRVVWDEANLDYNEANKSAQMKIEEVPTPFIPCTDVQVSDEEDCKLPPPTMLSMITKRVAQTTEPLLLDCCFHSWRRHTQLCQRGVPREYRRATRGS